jgi:hypothetical protein
MPVTIAERLEFSTATLRTRFRRDSRAGLGTDQELAALVASNFRCKVRERLPMAKPSELKLALLLPGGLAISSFGTALLVSSWIGS